jgi:putative addiction module killer protein
VVEIRHYVSRAGKDVFDDWLSELADARAQARIASRINRLAAGNIGDCKPLRRGVCELWFCQLGLAPFDHLIWPHLSY